MQNVAGPAGPNTGAGVILSLALFSQIAAHCAPSVHAQTLAAIARTESGFQSTAIYDNTTRRRYLPHTHAQAITLATDLVIRQGHSVDLGIMQINSANLPALSMTVADVFDPCRNIDAGARILTAGYRPPGVGNDPQPALLRAVSRYNTGSPVRGFANGYVAKVVDAAAPRVPAIRGGGSAPIVLLKKGRVVSAPPSWDVYGQAKYVREYGVAPVEDLSAAEQHYPPAFRSERTPQPSQNLQPDRFVFAPSPTGPRNVR